MKFFSIVLLLILSGCSKQPDLEVIKRGFIEKRESFNRLSAMIREDNKFHECFAVGTDHIGDYWEHNGKWETNQNYEHKTPLANVLEKFGISHQRYNDYLILFKETGSERIVYCPEVHGSTSILVFRDGLSIAGCLTTININNDLSVPEPDINARYSSIITSLGDGWYINHDCT
jgi:hypothetical protein